MIKTKKIQNLKNSVGDRAVPPPPPPAGKKEGLKIKKRVLIWVFLILFVVVLALALIGGTVPMPYTAMVTYSEEIPVTKTETYTDTEPYTDKECNQVKIKYVGSWGNINSDCLQQECSRHEQYCVDYNFWGNCVQYAERCVDYQCIKYRMNCRYTIKNIDDTGGTFKLDGYVYDRDYAKDIFVTSGVSAYVQPTMTGTLSWSYVYPYTSSISCIYRNLQAPTKTVCENVIKTRKVTKERTVVGTETRQKEKEEVKYSPLFEQWGWIS